MTARRLSALPISLLVLCLLLPLGGCRLDALPSLNQTPQGPDPVDAVSPQDEYYLGRATAARILQQYPPLRASAANNYANRLGQALALFSPGGSTYGGFFVQLLDTDETVSFAAPGGFILVSRGMLRHVTGESEFAALLSHEIAHVQNKDAVRAVSPSRLREAAARTRDAAREGKSGAPAEDMVYVFEGCVDDIVGMLTGPGFTREQEHAAHRGAAAILARAGYEPAALDSLLSNLRGASGGSLQTHPDPSGFEGQKNAAPLKETGARAKRFAAALGQYAGTPR